MAIKKINLKIKISLRAKLCILTDKIRWYSFAFINFPEYYFLVSRNQSATHARKWCNKMAWIFILSRLQTLPQRILRPEFKKTQDYNYENKTINQPKEISKSSCGAYMVSVPWAFLVDPLKVHRHHLCLKCENFYGMRLWTTNSQECMLLACGHYQRHTPLKTWFEPQAYAFHHITLHVNGEKVAMDTILRMVIIFGCYWRKPARAKIAKKVVWNWGA